MSIFKGIAAYQLVKLISTSFDKWDAFKHGLINKDGETTRKPKTAEEKKSFSMFHRLVRRIKQIMMKAPFGAFKIASLAIALKLLKEDTGFDLSSELEQFGLNNQLLEHSHYTTDNTLSQGKYQDPDGNIFIVKENLQPIDNIIGVNIYEVKEVVSKERILVSIDTINKI